ncbi:MAG: GAF domain-containing sensor histidine kinase [Actinomycetota bacterium]|nr:GAF domain-containing sensor histidine kinase [Actinomycetota bacterium]
MRRSQHSAHDFAEYLVAVSAAPNVAQALHEGARRAAEAVGAEVAVVVAAGEVIACVGYADTIPVEELVAVATAGRRLAPVPGAGNCPAISVPLDASLGALVIARSWAPLALEEVALLHGMCRALMVTTRMLRSMASLQERNELLGRLSRIQRSISHRAPLQEVLDAITRGASELLGVEVVGVRLIDPDDPGTLLLASAHGIRPELIEKIRVGPVGEGAGGRAIAEDRLVMIDSYTEDRQGLAAFRADGLQTAMAAPVHEHGRVVGSMTIASYERGRRYSEMEQSALVALSEHASLALTDARTVQAMRDAQQTKDLFLAMVSHELKTPLTVIMASLRTLEKRSQHIDEDRRREMLAIAYRRGRELERLIDGLLQGARAELSTKAERVFLPDLIRETVAAVEGDRVRVAANPPASLWTDADAVQVVLANLLDNALAHSPAGSPVIVEAGVDDDTLTLTVTNQGYLPDDLDAAELFLPFQRGSRARSSGVGLGLSVGARLAESLGGTLQVTDLQGRVAFSLRVPCSAA